MNLLLGCCSAIWNYIFPTISSAPQATLSQNPRHAMPPAAWRTVYVALSLDCNIAVLESLFYNAWRIPLTVELFNQAFAPKITAIIAQRGNGKSTLAKQLCQYEKVTWLVEHIDNRVFPTLPTLQKTIEQNLSNTTIVVDDLHLPKKDSLLLTLIRKIRFTPNCQLIIITQDPSNDLPYDWASYIDCFLIGKIYSPREKQHLSRLVPHMPERYPSLLNFTWFVSYKNFSGILDSRREVEGFDFSDEDGSYHF